ncbi:cytochrome o ubiquinol oxidase subunit III [Buchnera aphidicola (Sarucallis kahawaluokalani)]|uniref:Cytochrome bo(3) ubiquinol oxidase subunit 3 n=2 Tax=Buchnera aphidicola TaxID=9 RepID=A0A4D6Y9X2_9GAMM|nr:cytochrome o ubiquinol oxidase subunit III [Buchnera aphidicola (Sarucallis kahawaluokalani)]
MIHKHKNILDKCNVLQSNNTFGFWLYLMSDCILFATMFAVYCVVRINVKINHNIFDLKIVFLETIILLISSIFCGVVVLSVKYQKILFTYIFLILTFLMGSLFLYFELNEFFNLVNLGYTPQKNGFFSSFFTLIGMHGIHIACGLFWIIGLLFQANKLRTSNKFYVNILCFSLFWHFLDIIWICIFTIVYLSGNIL